MTQAQPTGRPSVVVVGAGAFGGWTALHLARAGARVTLLDAFGPGNSRASSGGETRIIRALYADRIYVQMTVRAFEIWKASERQWGQRLLRQNGFLRLVSKDDPVVSRSAALFREAGLKLEEFTPAEAGKRFPQFRFDGIDRVLLDPAAGYLPARRGCALVAEALQKEGGEYREMGATPGEIRGGELRSVTLSDGSSLTADQYVFACGPWMGKLFPEVIGDRIRAYRREVFFFGVPAGDRNFQEYHFPCWGDSIEHYYGVPGNEWRGFKIGEERDAVPFDPTNGDRTVSPEGLRAVREYMKRRFPSLAGAPLVESRICQYEQTPDKHLVFDRHPQAGNVLLLGGGSGHGYKLGAALGEMAAGVVMGKRAPEPMLSLARFK